MNIAWKIVATGIAAGCLGPLSAQAPPAPGDAFAFVRALEEAGGRNAWPGFSPSDLPIALFDGEKTLLFRHPSPPPEFKPMPDRPGVFVSPGRHSGVVSNSTREIGGVRTATVLATPGQNAQSTLLACVEEAFHVFWLARHATFRPNEMARYAYPMTDAGNLERMLAEDEALARAVDAERDDDAAAWAATALRIRGERTPSLSEEVRAFEAALEMMEGTANYVARVALGETPGATSARLRQGRPAEGIRWRFYDTGASLCFLLDRFDRGWKTRIDGEPDLTIADLLDAALARRLARPRAFSEKELAGFTARTVADVADLKDRQRRIRADLLDWPGARVVIETADGIEPFRVQRFDPVNLPVLDGGEVAHPNFITLANASGTVEVTNGAFVRGSFAGTAALTMAAGRHPLSDGIRRLTVVGVGDSPTVSHDAGGVSIETPGLRVSLRNADVQRNGGTVRVTVSSAAPRRPEGAVSRGLRPGEAVVWYLGHCGFAVRTERHLLIFDYQERRDGPQPRARPDVIGLDRGWIDPAEIAADRVRVFVSHPHDDHHDRVTSSWRKSIPDIAYFYGWNATDQPASHNLAGPRATFAADGVEVFTINSHHSGVPEVAFLVKVDGLVVYHNGDYRMDYRADFPYLERHAGRVDLAFVLGVSDEKLQYALQNRDFFERFRPRAVFPMHAEAGAGMYHEFEAAFRARLPGLPVVVPERLGDRFEYREGRIRRVASAP